MATLKDVVTAVRDELNNMEAMVGGVAVPFVATSSLLPSFTLKEFKSLRITVVPRAQTFSRQSRQQTGREMEIDIGVQKKFNQPRDYEEEGELLLGLVEEIAGHFDGKRLPGMSIAICTNVINDPVYSPEHIEQYHQFTSVLTLTIKLLE